MDLATVPGSFTASYVSIRLTTSPAAHTIHKAMDLLKLWWELPRKLMEKSVKEGKPWNYGLLQCRTTPSVLLFHHDWRCWQEEDHIQAFHNFHPVLARTWKSPEFVKNCLGGSPTTPLPWEPWIWSLDNLSLSRKWIEVFGEQPLLTNQQLSQIPFGWDFQTTPYWEGLGQWLSQGLYLLILSFRLKHNRETFEGETHSHSCESFSQLNGQSMLPVTLMVSVTNPAAIDRGSKVSETPDPINSTGASQPTVERGAISSIPPIPRCSTRSTKGVPPVHYTPSRKWMDYSDVLCVQVVQWIGLLVLSLSSKRSTDLWNMNYVDYSSPLVFILNFTLVTLKVNTIHWFGKLKIL